jgi:hypothetical protein
VYSLSDLPIFLQWPQKGVLEALIFGYKVLVTGFGYRFCYKVLYYAFSTLVKKVFNFIENRDILKNNANLSLVNNDNFGFGNKDLDEPTRENNPHRTYHIAASEYYPA